MPCREFRFEHDHFIEDHLPMNRILALGPFPLLVLWVAAGWELLDPVPAGAQNPQLVAPTEALPAAEQIEKFHLPPGFVIHHPGAKANPFLANAAAAVKSQSEAILRREIKSGIEKQARLLAAKGKA